MRFSITSGQHVSPEYGKIYKYDRYYSGRPMGNWWKPSSDWLINSTVCLLEYKTDCYYEIAVHKEELGVLYMVTGILNVAYPMKVVRKIN